MLGLKQSLIAGPLNRRHIIFFKQLYIPWGTVTSLPSTVSVMSANRDELAENCRRALHELSTIVSIFQGGCQLTNTSGCRWWWGSSFGQSGCRTRQCFSKHHRRMIKEKVRRAEDANYDERRSAVAGCSSSLSASAKVEMNRWVTIIYRAIGQTVHFSRSRNKSGNSAWIFFCCKTIPPLNHFKYSRKFGYYASLACMINLTWDNSHKSIYYTIK